MRGEGWERSTVGSAFALHARGHEFKSRRFQASKVGQLSRSIHEEKDAAEGSNRYKAT